MIHFLRRKKILSRIGELGLIVFIISLGLSLIDTIWAIYLYQFLQSDVLVGVVSAIFTAASLFSYVSLIPFIQRHDKSHLYQWSLFFSGLCYILFAATGNFFVILTLGILLSILSVIRIDCFGILVKDCSKLHELAQNEGAIYTSLNIGWLVGPLIAGYAAEHYGIPLVFLLSGFFLFLALASYKFLHLRCKPRIRKETDGNFFKNIKDYFRNRDLLKNYIVSGSSSVWWSFIFIYMPLYILERGLDVAWVAYFLFAVFVPIILLEYYFGRLADRVCYTRLFVIAYLVLSVFLLFAFFTDNIYLLLFLLVCGGIGIAMVEPSTEAYFFLVAPKKRIEKYYSVYNTTLDVFSTVGKLFIAGVLFLLPFRYSFLFLALLFLCFAVVGSFMREVSGGQRVKKSC